MSTYSTNLALELIGNGEQAGNWGQTTNTNLGTLVEQAISGYVTLPMADSDQTLSMTQGASATARNMYIELTGALTAARNVIVPGTSPNANKKLYFIFNNTTGGFAVTVKVFGQTGVSVPNGTKTILVCNGTDIVSATTAAAVGVSTFSAGSTGFTPNTATTGAVTLAGTLAIANGGTGATSAGAALSNLGGLTASNPSYSGTLTGATGLILVGTTAPTLSTNTFTVAAAKPALVLGNSTTADSSPALTCIKFGATNSTSQRYVSFSYSSGSGGNGAIAGNGDSQATFVTDSDARLKENIVDLPSQLANILALRPVEFDYKATKNHQTGFIAQEVKEVYPDLVSEGGDGYLTLAGLDKNAARLIKAIQELKAIVDAQAVRIAALESR